MKQKRDTQSKIISATQGKKTKWKTAKVSNGNALHGSRSSGNDMLKKKSVADWRQMARAKKCEQQRNNNPKKRRSAKMAQKGFLGLSLSLSSLFFLLGMWQKHEWKIWKSKTFFSPGFFTKRVSQLVWQLLRNSAYYHSFLSWKNVLRHNKST